MAGIVPTGTPTTDMMTPRKNVPMMAGKIPPAVMPSVGAWEMKAQVRWAWPPQRMVPIIHATAAIEMNAHEAVPPTTKRPIHFFFEPRILSNPLELFHQAMAHEKLGD